MESKAQLRERLLRHRRSLTNVEVAHSTGTITAEVLLQLDWRSARRVHIYASSQSWKEIGTIDLIEALGKLYPNLEIKTSTSKADAVFPDGQFDVIIVPVLGFDRRGYRLGLGKGWYDRFLAGQKRARKVGLAYSWGEVPRLPEEPHDIPLDAIITEKKLILCD